VSRGRVAWNSGRSRWTSLQADARKAASKCACRMIFHSPPRGFLRDIHAAAEIPRTEQPINNSLSSLMMAENGRQQRFRFFVAHQRARSAWRWWKDIAARDGSFCGYASTAERAGPRVCSRLDSGAAPAALWRCRIRLGSSRQHDQRGCRLARSTAGSFHSPYQPTESALFHEMIGALSKQSWHSIFATSSSSILVRAKDGRC
jgi:hypothetical protein